MTDIHDFTYAVFEKSNITGEQQKVIEVCCDTTNSVIVRGNKVIRLIVEDILNTEYQQQVLDLDNEELRYYQLEALQILKQVVNDMYYIDDELVSHGKVILPTGCGKTKIFLRLIIEEIRNINIITAPTISLLRQLEFEFKTYAKKLNKDKFFSYLVVSSDSELLEHDELGDEIHLYEKNPTTDPEVILDFIKTNYENNNRMVIFSTMKSLYKVGEVLKTLEKVADMVIYDEAHRATGKGINCTLTHENFPVEHKLFFTATEKNKISNTDELLDFPMENEEYFGKTLYSKTAFEMITEEFILPPFIVASSFNDENAQKIYNILNDVELNENILENITAIDVKKELALMLSGLLAVYKETGYIKTIAFTQSIKIAEWYKSQFKIINKILTDILGHEVEGLYFDVIKQQVVGSDRLAMIKRFDNSKNAILFNYQVIKEGIDIQECNSVCWMRKMDSIGLMQSAGRALRKKGDKKYGYIICPINTDSKEKGKYIENMKNIALTLFQEGYKDTVIDPNNIIGFVKSISNINITRENLEKLIPNGNVKEIYELLQHIEIKGETIDFKHMDLKPFKGFTPEYSTIMDDTF